ITFFAAFQLFPTIPFRIVELGGTKASAGLFLALYTYASAFTAPLTGTLADHLGRRRTLIFSALAFILFSLLYGVVTWLPLLIMIACIHGTFWSALLSASGAIITDIIPVSRRTEGLAYWGMAPTGAIAISPLVGIEVYRSGGWLVLCLGMAALSVVLTILAFRVRGGNEAKATAFPRIGQIVDWRVMLNAMTLFVMAFGYGGITSYVAMMSLERGIHPPSLFFTVTAIVMILTRILFAPLGDRFGPEKLLYPSVVVVPFGFALLAFATSRHDVILAGILFGVGFGGAYPAFMTFVLGHAHPVRRAATFGSILWAMDTGIGTGSFALGLIIEKSGYTAAFMTAVGLSALAIPIFLATAPLLRKQSAAANQE
ncbi:MAG TPA: MFS transporter, partial [Thermoanaerobaculia bacterium]|nr:MFS transporter [Thermoanaerobaculia bacterium]